MTPSKQRSILKKYTGKNKRYFIGWDVGGWHCDKNSNSRDAIVILNESLHIIGTPWRGNLRISIASCSTSSSWLKDIFWKCKAEYPTGETTVTMAIDTPLGFSEKFIQLVTAKQISQPDNDSGQNHYLYRKTERYLHSIGKRPLSAIKDMIGSQATKGIHTLAKFAPIVEKCGVWTDGGGFRALETYPAACRQSAIIKSFLKDRVSLGENDKNDALVCAIISYLFVKKRTTLLSPPRKTPESEGWIWIPR